MKKLMIKSIVVVTMFAAFVANAFTTGTVPADGVFKFTFGVNSTSDGSFAVPASAVFDASHEYANTAGESFTYGFLGTTATSYNDDKPWSLPSAPTAIDGFSVVQGQYIQLRDVAGAGVAGPLMADYLPSGASAFEGRYPVRFSMSAEPEAYYAVTCTVANVSSTANATVTLFSERCHIQAHYFTLAPGATRTFAWSVELFPNVYKTLGTYTDDAINVCVVGENAALKSLTVVKQPQTSGTIRGVATAKMNVGRTMWLCDDSTGTDQKNATPYFSLQNYSGVGSGLSRYAPANLSIRNQGEGGLATNAKAHRQSCMLKPGDFLYVEYGHNESGVTSFTNNLETYLSDANTAGAYLVIVSPVERRSSWNSDENKWNRSLQVYAEAGEAWVESKIAAGSRNVAFIDLNKRYNDWQNAELVRINGKNSAISLNAAINFYYRSAKGANVDNTHINNAGTDQAAYWVWYDALVRVAAGEADGATVSEKAQSDVLKLITTGYQAHAGIDDTTVTNLPWSVTDDIIAAGAAPNSFWDTPVTSGYEYVNDAAVAEVEAVANADGTVTISNITMRILNPGNYYKAVIDIVSADEASTNRYYSYYNYDVGGAGKGSGELVDPGERGFLTSDKDKAEVSAADLETLAVPNGGKAWIWFAEASDSTWQVGENAPCSAKYPLEWWSEVSVAADCSTTSGWTVNSGAVWSTNIVDGALYFTTTGADAGNTKKNFGICYPLDNSIAAGRYRISFKAMIEAGNISYVLGDSVYKTTTMLFNNNVSLFNLDSTVATGYKSTSPLITIDEEVQQAKVNASRWVDVDMIIDRDNARAWVSIGGSEYVEWQDTSFLPNSFDGRTWNYFGITCPGQESTYGYVSDIKIVKLAAKTYPTITISAAVGGDSQAPLGSVTINGSAVNSLTLYSGNDVMLKAESANVNLYKFSGWKNANDEIVSTAANLYYPAQASDINLTAVFTEYGANEDRVLTWDFSDYLGDFEVSGAAQTVSVNGMDFVITSDDKLTGSGLIWKNSANNGTSQTIYYQKYIKFVPPADGTFTLEFSVDNYNSSRKPNVNINATNEIAGCTINNRLAYTQVSASNTVYTLSAELEGGKTYYLWPYSYNWSGGKFYHNYTISSISYTYAPVYYAVSTAAEGPGTATVNEAASTDVLSGLTATFLAKPVTTAYKFTGWTDVEDNVVSTDNPYVVTVTDALALTANFAAIADGEEYAAVTDFSRYGECSDYSAVTVVSNGCFAIQMISGDYADANGIHWYKAAIDGSTKSGGLGSAVNETEDHFIKFTAPYSGTVMIDFSVDELNTSRKPNLMIKAADAASECTADTKDATVQVEKANTVYTLSHAVTAGTTYYIYVYSYNSGPGNYYPWITISNISYTHDASIKTLTLAADPASSGTVAVNGVVTNSVSVQAGEDVLLTATPNASSAFTSWTNSAEEVVSTDAEFRYYVTDTETLTANFEAFYVWTGAAEDGHWATAGNWLKGGVVPDTAPMMGTDTIKFTGDAVVTLPSTQMTYTEDHITYEGEVTYLITASSLTLSTQTINQDVTFKNGTVNLASASTVSGTGTVTFKDLTFAYSSSSDNGFMNPAKVVFSNVNIKNANTKYLRFTTSIVEFADGSVNTLEINKGRIGIETTVVGGGALTGTPVCQVYIDGDWSGYTGECTINGYYKASSTYGSIFNNGALDLSDSSWNFYTNGVRPLVTSGTGNLERWLWRFKNSTIKYGSLNGYVPYVYSICNSSYLYYNNTVEIGYLDQDNYLGGSVGIAADTSKYTFKWVAPTATFTFAVTNTYALAVTGGGVLKMAAPDGTACLAGLPSQNITFSGNGGRLYYDDNYESITAKIEVVNAPFGLDVPADTTATFDVAQLVSGSSVTEILKGGEGTMALASAPTVPVKVSAGKIAVEIPEGVVENQVVYTFPAGTVITKSQLAAVGTVPAGLVLKLATDAETGAINAVVGQPDPERIPVFLVGGQSNTDGRLDNSAADQLLPSYVASGVEGAHVSVHATYNENWTTNFLDWAPCTGGSGQASKWAYDTPLYYYLVQQFGDIYVAKSSYGGTSINPAVANSGSGTGLPQYGAGYHWSANATFLAATEMAGKTFVQDDVTYTGQSLLKGWIENIDGVIDAIAAEGNIADVKAIFWHQGESDKNTGTYAADLSEVVAYLRQHLATKLGDDKYLTIPFIYGSVPRKSSLFSVSLDNAFLSLDETEGNNMYMADIYDQSMKSGDSKHFNAVGAETLAKRMYNRLVDAGVASGAKLDVTDCVRAPDFGVEYVVNDTTTWTFENMSGDIAKLPSVTNHYGMYFHGYNSENRKLKIGDAGSTYSLAFTIGDTSSTVSTKQGVTAAYWWTEYAANILRDTTAGASGNLYHLSAVNVGRSGEFEALVATKYAATLYFNGIAVASVEASDSERLVHLKYANSGEGTYYLSTQGVLMGARFVPTTEQGTVTLTVPASGIGTFGNLWNCSFALPAGLTAYAVGVDSSDSRKLALTQVAALNRGDAFVVKGTAGTYTLSVGIGEAYDAENLMVAQDASGIVAETTGEDFINYLAGVDDDGYLMLTQSVGDTSLEAGKAYFSITEGDAHAAEAALYEVVPPTTYRYDVAENAVTNEATAISGTARIIKTGAGTLTLVGNNTFDGEIRVNAGTVKLGAYDYSSLISYDFDATATNNWTFDGENITKLKGTRGTEFSAVAKDDVYTYATHVASFAGFGGKPALYLPSGAAYNVSKKGSESSMYVYYKEALTSGYVARYSSQDFIQLSSDGKWYAKKYNSWINDYLRVNGTVDRTFTAAKAELLTLNSAYRASANRNDVVGSTDNSGFDIYLGEVIGFNAALTDDQLGAIEMALAWKWNLPCRANMQPIPAAGEVSVAAGATLDFGSYSGLACESLALADGATLALDSLPANGVLVTADSITLGGSLTIKVGGVVDTKAYARVVTNGDGTKSLKIKYPTGLRVFFY